MTSNSVINEIDQLLPQTQCQKCGYKDCRAYAKAIAETGENINRCAPGGNEVIDSLSELTKRPRLELDKTIQATHLESTAMIDEEYCIGCTLCIDACPIDSIIGAAKRTHTILNSICSGCGLCLPPCPTNCITIVPLNAKIKNQKPSSQKLIKLSQSDRSELWRNKYQEKILRGENKNSERTKEISAQLNTEVKLKIKEKRIIEALEIARRRLKKAGTSVI